MDLLGILMFDTILNVCCSSGSARVNTKSGELGLKPPTVHCFGRWIEGLQWEEPVLCREFYRLAKVCLL